MILEFIFARAARNSTTRIVFSIVVARAIDMLQPPEKTISGINVFGSAKVRIADQCWLTLPSVNVIWLYG